MLKTLTCFGSLFPVPVNTISLLITENILKKKDNTQNKNNLLTNTINN